MKGLLIPLAGVLAFVIGIAGVYYWIPLPTTEPVPNAQPPKVADVPQFVTINELMRDPERYNGQIVQVRAVAAATGQGEVYLYDSPGGGEMLAGVCGERSEQCARMIPGLSMDRVVEISATGRFSGSREFDGDGAAWIIARYIQISDIQVYDADGKYRDVPGSPKLAPGPGTK